MNVEDVFSEKPEAGSASSNRMSVKDVLEYGVASEEGGWLVVDAVSEVPKPIPGVVSDATSFGCFSNIEQSYEQYISVEDLPDIEQDLLPEDVVRMLFLIVEDVPTLILQKCIVKLQGTAGKDKAVSDSFSEWARRSNNSNWKSLFMEGLALIGRFDVLDCMGLKESEMKTRKHNPVFISSLKVALNDICRQLLMADVKKLVEHMTATYTTKADQLQPPSFPEGRVLGHLLELHLLYWMQGKIISLQDLSRLAEGLRFIGRQDLMHLLGGKESEVAPAPQPEHQREFHSKIVHLDPLGQPAPLNWYPNTNGLCIVFNQEAFQCSNSSCELATEPYHSYRIGSNHDADNLKATFDPFGCTTKVFTNLSADDIRKRLDMLSKANDLARFDYLVLCFLSHGGTALNGQHYIYSSDCQKLVIEQMAAYFGGDYCPALRNKLKIVVTQACQGVHSLQVVADGPTDAVPPSARPQMSASASLTPQSDFLFCQATTPGHKAYRDPQRGSFYIIHLCQVLSLRGHLMEITVCVKDVHARMKGASVYLDKQWCGMQPQMIDRTSGQFIFKRKPPASI